LVVGALIASTGVVALWAIGEYAVDLQRDVFTNWYVHLKIHHALKETSYLTPEEVHANVNTAINTIYIIQMAAGGLGMVIFTKIAGRMGRRPAFALGFTAAMIVTFMVYWKMDSPAQGRWMIPLMSCCQLAVFAGFAIYLPELFPSRLRSTGTSFCYNLGRFAAAAGSLFSAAMATKLYGRFGSPLMERYSAMTMCGVFLVGILALPFAPETKGKPLPEEQP
jgi:MFS family permease